MNVSVFVSTFLAASIEVIEMVAIVVAVGVTRQWRGALAGTLAGLVVLAVLIAALGTALQSVPLTALRLVVGALLLVFGLQWLRKGIRLVSRDGWASGIGEQRVEEDVGDGFDWTGVVSGQPQQCEIVPGPIHAQALARPERPERVYVAAGLVLVRVVSHWRRDTAQRPACDSLQR